MPIEQVKHRMIESGTATEADLKEIDREVRGVVTEAAEFAQSDREPDPAELWDRRSGRSVSGEK